MNNKNLKKLIGKEQETPNQMLQDNLNEIVKIPVVELYDESGAKVVFEVLETIEYGDDKYCLLTPYYETEEEYELDKPADVFIMKKMVSVDSDEPMLETVDNDKLLQTIYNVFKEKHANEFQFRDY